MALPEGFARRITDLHGDLGRDWLDRLPRRVQRCAEEWSLTLGRPFPSLSYSFVAPATRRDGAAAILKMGVPGPALTAEIKALRLMEGRGSVRLLAADPARGALLLERLVPGTALATLCPEHDEEATSIAATVMQRLWRAEPAQHTFPRVTDWVSGFREFRRTRSPLPPAWLDRADRWMEELIQSCQQALVLHGDLHHGNILAAEREAWLAIDPKGVLGEPAFEAGALLRNPMPEILAFPELRRVLGRRIDQLSEQLGLDKQRVLGWGIAQAVLAASWAFEDHGSEWEPWIACAEHFLAIET